MPLRLPFVGGNWKMNTNRQTSAELARAVAAGLADVPKNAAETCVFPPFVYLQGVADCLSTLPGAPMLGAQDVYPKPDGAFTGEVSLAMLKDLRVAAVLTGHSERRHVIGENDALVGQKASVALSGGLRCVLCVGETLEQRQAGRTDAVNEAQIRAGLSSVPAAQLDRLIVAYEPVWAIGTGKTATPADAQDAHAKIRSLLSRLYDQRAAESIRIIYGGSVKPDAADQLAAQPDIDGFLVGGASLVAKDFLAICHAASRSRARLQGTAR